jgi:hypothetical protein
MPVPDLIRELSRASTSLQPGMPKEWIAGTSPTMTTKHADGPSRDRLDPLLGVPHAQFAGDELGEERVAHFC